MPERSESTKRYLDIGGEMSKMKEDGEKAFVKAQPFGTDKLRKDDAANRIRNMSPAQRAVLVKSMGGEAVVKILRKGE